MVLKHQSSQAVLWLRTATQWPAPDRALHCLTYGAGGFLGLPQLVKIYKAVLLFKEGRAQRREFCSLFLCSSVLNSF